MAYDYTRYFGEIAVLRDLTTMPEEAGWRTAAPAENDERHPIVPPLSEWLAQPGR